MGGGQTILVVDDNSENRALARATLEDEGYRVQLACNGAEAIESFLSAPPDCVLLDVRMPGMDGVSVCEHIRALPGGELVPIVFVTALRDVDTFDRAVHAGGDDFLTKPVRPHELIVRVLAALKLRRMKEERGELYAEIKQQREALQRLQLQKEQMIGFLVHDLKGPVTGIDLQAQLVLRDKTSSDRARRAANRIHDETRTLVRMITNLLDIGRADEGRLTPRYGEVQVRALIDDVLATHEARALAAELRFEVEVDATTLRADHDLMRRVIENLVDNAIRHAPSESAVRVSASTSGGAFELRVADAGPGVPEEERAHVFERFAQHETRHTSVANRGLGLTFCKLAVEAHGGEIWIEDAAPGAVFCIRLREGPP